MEKWPAWSAPLLGGCGGGLGGLALTGDPRFRFPPLKATLAGVALGVLAGLIIWHGDQLKRAEATPPSAPTQRAVTAPSSRRAGFLFIVGGIGCLVANHALVLSAGEKLLALVVGGSLFVAVGLAGLILPQILTAWATGERVPWVGPSSRRDIGRGGLGAGDVFVVGCLLTGMHADPNRYRRPRAARQAELMT